MDTQEKILNELVKARETREINVRNFNNSIELLLWIGGIIIAVMFWYISIPLGIIWLIWKGLQIENKEKQMILEQSSKDYHIQEAVNNHPINTEVDWEKAKENGSEAYNEALDIMRKTINEEIAKKHRLE